MKNKALLFLAILLTSCSNCLLSQIPPQYLFVGNDCQAVLPDYLSRVTATDNCNLATLVQIPESGTILTSAQAVYPVEIRATDSLGNHSSVNFSVILVDTIPPRITIDSTLLTGDFEILETLYNQAERIIANKMQVFDSTFPYDRLGLPVSDSTYFKEYLITTTTPGYAVTGNGQRMWQFWRAGDEDN